MKRGGFTLTETVVALTLFAAAATVLVQAAVHARQGLLRLEEWDPWSAGANRVREDLLAITDRKKLEEGGEMELARNVRKRGDDAVEGPAQATGPIRARWEVEILPTPVLDVHQLTIRMILGEGGEISREDVSSYYVYRPGWYEGKERDALLADKREKWERRQLDRGAP